MSAPRIVCVVIAIAAALATAHADGEVDRAIRIGGEGIALYEQRRFADAYERFAVADRMAHSIVFVLYMARCKRNLGELVAARDLLAQVVRDTLPANATEPMRRAHAEATPELATLSARIPSLVVIVKGDAMGTRIRIGDQLVASGVAIDLDPGEHTVEVTSEDTVPVVRTVKLAEGSGPSTLSLTLISKDRGERRGSRAPAWIAFGVGATGTAVGAVTGVLALRNAGAVKDNCIEGHCLPGDRARADRAETLGTVSTVALAAAGVSIATGLVLWWVRPGGERTAITAGTDGVTISGTF